MPPLGSRLLKRFAKRIPKAVAGSFASLRSKPVSTRYSLKTVKSAMDRPPCDSGFTLVEMLLVLLLLSVLLLVTPLLKRQQRILLRMDVQQIREICTKAQAQAIREHKSIPIKIQGSKVYCNREIYSLQSSTSCRP